MPLAEQIDLLYKTGYVAECNDAMAKQYGFKKTPTLSASLWIIFKTR